LLHFVDRLVGGAPLMSESWVGDDVETLFTLRSQHHHFQGIDRLDLAAGDLAALGNRDRLSGILRLEDCNAHADTRCDAG
jgi:hypothetical protein